MTMTMTIDFNFAKWQKEKLEKEVNEKIAEGRLGNYTQKLMGELKVWRELMIASCPKHEYETIKSKYDYEEDICKCKHCGGRSDVDEIYNVMENVIKGCHNCIHLEKEGGDWVPYGSTSTQLPETQYCLHSTFEDEEKEDDMLKQMENSHQCPYWIGK